MLEETLSIVGMRGKQRDADTRRDVDVQPLHIEGRPERVADLVGHRQCRRLPGRGGDQKPELVTTEPREHVGRAQRAVEAWAYLTQQRITGVMSERVVELLEVVQVDDQQRERRAG